VACGLTSGCVAACPRGLASPDHVGAALTAQPVGLLGDRSARTVTTPVLGEYGDEVVHWNPFAFGAAVGPFWPAMSALYASQSASGSPDAITAQRDGRWT
jgi:hypothetical protein